MIGDRVVSSDIPENQAGGVRAATGRIGDHTWNTSGPGAAVKGLGVEPRTPKAGAVRTRPAKAWEFDLWCWQIEQDGELYAFVRWFHVPSDAQVELEPEECLQLEVNWHSRDGQFLNRRSVYKTCWLRGPNAGIKAGEAQVGGWLAETFDGGEDLKFTELEDPRQDPGMDSIVYHWLTDIQGGRAVVGVWEAIGQDGRRVRLSWERNGRVDEWFLLEVAIRGRRPVYWANPRVPDEVGEVEAFLRKHGFPDSQAPVWRSLPTSASMSDEAREWERRRNQARYRRLRAEQAVSRGDPVDSCPRPTPKPPRPPWLDGKRDWVYFIRAGADGPIKIGVARNPSSRLAELRTGSHLPLRLVAAVPGGYVLEAQLHADFAAHRTHGEWFEAAPMLLERIASIERLGGWRAVEE